MLCAVGGNGDPTSTEVIFTSINGGVTWTPQTNPIGYPILRSITYSETLGLWCAVGTDISDTAGYILTSVDGETWIQRAHPEQYYLRSIMWSDYSEKGQGEFWAVGNPDGTSAYAIKSYDGVSWTREPMTQNFALRGIANSPDLLMDIAVGANTGSMAYITEKHLGSNVVLSEADQYLFKSSKDHADVVLSWSVDGGHTWSNEHVSSMGKKGEYIKRVIWRRIGCVRNWTPRILISDPVKKILIGSSIEAERQIK